MSFFNDKLFIPALFGAWIKVRCVLECSLNVNRIGCLNFSIWSILAPSTIKKHKVRENGNLHLKGTNLKRKKLQKSQFLHL